MPFRIGQREADLRTRGDKDMELLERELKL